MKKIVKERKKILERWQERGYRKTERLRRKKRGGEDSINQWQTRWYFQRISGQQGHSIFSSHMRPRPPVVKHNQEQKHIPHQHHHFTHRSSSAPSTSWLLLSLSSSVIDTMKTQTTAMSTTRGSVATLSTCHDSDRTTSSVAARWHQSSRQLRENREVCLWWEVISKPSWVSVDVVDLLSAPVFGFSFSSSSFSSTRLSPFLSSVTRCHRPHSSLDILVGIQLTIFIILVIFSHQ